MAITGACVALVAGLTTATMANAASTPTVSEAQAKVNLYTSEYDQANQQYDKVETQLTSAKQRLAQLDKQLSADQKLFKTAHAAVAAIAANTYEDSGSMSLAGLLTSNNPSQVLNEASMILELAGSRNEQTQAYLADAQQLANVQQEQQRTEQGIQTLADQKASAKNSSNKSLQQWQATLDSLNSEEQGEISTVGSGGSTSGTYTGPTNTVMEKAVAYVFDQLGCPYVYGSTGPCDEGFDCSGLMYAAYQSVGITLPRDTYEEWADLPHISESDIQPGDLMIYNDIGHVAMYVGNGMIIDAPHTGADVEEVSMNESWYADNFDGALAP
ncbi:MAG: NlpC/P60 family protein [Streptosporangiaceae bacterium]